VFRKVKRGAAWRTWMFFTTVDHGNSMDKVRKDVAVSCGTSEAALPEQINAKVESSQEFQYLFTPHKITEWSWLAGSSVGHPAQPPAQAGSPRAVQVGLEYL